MIGDLGAFALLLAGACALLCAVVALASVRRPSPALLQLGRRAHLAHSLCLLASLMALYLCFWRNDLTLSYVARHGHADLSAWAQLKALWQGPPGLWLLCALVALLCSWGFVWQSRALGRAFQLRVLGLLSWLLACVELTLWLLDSPFARALAPPPLEGQAQLSADGLQPYLIAWALGSCALVLALNVASWRSGGIDGSWLRWLRPWWALATLALLGLAAHSLLSAPLGETLFWPEALLPALATGLGALQLSGSSERSHFATGWAYLLSSLTLPALLAIGLWQTLLGVPLGWPALLALGLCLPLFCLPRRACFANGPTLSGPTLERCQWLFAAALLLAAGTPWWPESSHSWDMRLWPWLLLALCAAALLVSRPQQQRVSALLKPLGVALLLSALCAWALYAQDALALFQVPHWLLLTAWGLLFWIGAWRFGRPSTQPRWYALASISAALLAISISAQLFASHSYPATFSLSQSQRLGPATLQLSRQQGLHAEDPSRAALHFTLTHAGTTHALRAHFRERHSASWATGQGLWHGYDLRVTERLGERQWSMVLRIRPLAPLSIWALGLLALALLWGALAQWRGNAPPPEPRRAREVLL